MQRKDSELGWGGGGNSQLHGLSSRARAASQDSPYSMAPPGLVRTSQGVSMAFQWVLLCFIWGFDRALGRGVSCCGTPGSRNPRSLELVRGSGSLFVFSVSVTQRTRFGTGAATRTTWAWSTSSTPLLGLRVYRGLNDRINASTHPLYTWAGAPRNLVYQSSARQTQGMKLRSPPLG